MALRIVALGMIIASVIVSVLIMLVSTMFAPAGTRGIGHHPIAIVLLAVPLIGVFALAACAYRDAPPRTMAAIGALPLLCQGLIFLTFVRMGTLA